MLAAVRAALVAACGLAAAAAFAAAARAQGWTEPDPAAVVGRWDGGVTWRQCAVAGERTVALAVGRDGSGYRIDLGALLDGLRAEVFAPIGGPTLEASRADLHATFTAGKPGRAALRLELGGGCQIDVALRRQSTGTAACDELAGLRAVADACPALAEPPPRTVAIEPVRRGGKKPRAAACRREAAPLRAALVEVGCVPAPAPAAQVAIPECDALIATVQRATRCDRVPVDMKQRLAEQIRIVARSAAVAEPEARALLVDSCRVTRDEIVDTLALVGCAPP